MSNTQTESGMSHAMDQAERVAIMTQIGTVISQAQHFWIFCHENPDGDALGCCLGFYGALTELGKEALVFTPDPLSTMFHGLPFADKVIVTKELPDAPPDAIIVADTGEFNRIGSSYAAQLTALGIGPNAASGQVCPMVNFDHHVSNDKFGTINLIDPAVGACGQLVYETLKFLELPLNLDVAVNLYTTIMTDTGRFSYGNTSSESFAVASDLIRIGVDPHDTFNRVYNTRSIQQMMLFSKVLSTVVANPELGYFTCEVTQDMLEATGCEMSDTEGILDIIKTVADFQACFFLKETDKELIKVSSRSNGTFDCNQFASRFGGGGHPAASGFKIRQAIEQAPGVLAAEFKAYLTDLQTTKPPGTEQEN